MSHSYPMRHQPGAIRPDSARWSRPDEPAGPDPPRTVDLYGTFSAGALAVPLEKRVPVANAARGLPQLA